MKESEENIHKDLGVTGMTCAACASSLQTWLGHQEGIVSAEVNYANQSLLVNYNPSLIDLKGINKAAKEIGYGVVSQEELEIEERNRSSVLKRNLIISIIFSIPVFILSMFFMDSGFHYLILGLTLPVMIWGGAEFFIKAWNGLKNGQTNMDTLVALSTGIAFLYSTINTLYPELALSYGITPHIYFESAVVIITLILLGRYLESKARSKTTEALKQLISLQAKDVHLILGDTIKNVSIAAVLPGQVVLIKPGEMVPVDGKVVKGTSLMDVSMITGEPLPVEVYPGKIVHSGTINQKGILEVQIEKTGKDTLLAQIIALVKKAQASKPPIQLLVDRVAGVFVPVVMLMATITFVFWWWFGGSMSMAIVSLISILIIACPCALGLATPTALIVGLGNAARNGILIRDADSLQIAPKVTDIVMDKTGTLTQGRANVNQVYWDEQIDKTLMTSVLYNLEQGSEHPLAGPIVEYLSSQNPKSLAIDSLTSITGKGITGKYESTEYFVGSERLLSDNGLTLQEAFRLQAEILEKKSNTVVYFSNKEKVMALISIADQLKSKAIETIHQMQNKNLTVHMLTGDNNRAARSLAEQLSISNFKGGMLPQEKSSYIKELQKKNKVVAMVGDGINDAPALSQADLGISLSTGSDLAIESAGITLMNGDIGKILPSLQLSKATLKTIRQNLFWAFIYNIVAIPIAAGLLYPINGFLLNPMIAGGAMALSSLCVVGNSLRLKKFKINP